MTVSRTENADYIRSTAVDIDILCEAKYGEDAMRLHGVVNVWCGLLLLLGSSTQANAGGVSLYGVVVRNKSRGQPMPGVQVTSGGAHPQVTLDDGRFALYFSQGNPGQEVLVKAVLSGWSVVNDILLQLRLPQSGHTDLDTDLEIILCRDTECDEWRTMFYLHKTNRNVDRAIERKLDDVRVKLGQITNGVA